jgi:hypothetical protein
VGVANRLETFQRDFLWDGIGDEAKFHLVNWKKICTRIKMGGLGVRNLLQFNRALFGKWLWRYALEREALWRLVIKAKYESMRGGWCSKEVMGYLEWAFGNTLERGGIIFPTFFALRGGNGFKVSF